MIRAYFDESGTDEKDFVIVAGHAGRKANWIAFMTLWKAALGKNRTRLHMRSLRWNSIATQKLLSKLGPIPAQCGLVPVVGGLRVGDYADMVVGNSYAPLVRGYCAALMSAISGLMRATPRNDEIQIIVEENEAFKAQGAMVFLAAKNATGPVHQREDGSQRLTMTNILDKNSPHAWLLDQADFLAFAHLQNQRDPNTKKAQWSAPILGRYAGAILNREQAREFVSELPPSPFTDEDVKVFLERTRAAINSAKV